MMNLRLTRTATKPDPTPSPSPLGRGISYTPPLWGGAGGGVARRPYLRGVSFALLIGLCALIQPISPSHAQTGATFCISQVDAKNFPNVQFQLRAVDAQNKGIGGLSSASLPIFENGQQVPPEKVQVTPHNDGAITTIFVIDRGRAASFLTLGAANIQQAINQLIDGGHFKDGIDTVQVMLRENQNSNDQTRVLLSAAQQGIRLKEAISAFDFKAGRAATLGLEGAREGLDEMGKLVPETGSQTAVLVFVSSGIESPKNDVALQAAQAHAQTARNNLITIYSIQPKVTAARQQVVSSLASGAFGRNLVLNPGTVASDVDGLYRAIDAERVYYTVNYSSTLNTPGLRQITANTVGASGVCRTGSYLPVDTQAPIVEMTSPQTTDTVARDLLTIKAKVSWRDNIQGRSIQSARLLIDDQIVSGARPKIEPDQVSFDIDLSDARVLPANAGRAKVTVEVTDSLSKVSFAEVRINVRAGASTPAPVTPEPEKQDGSNDLLVPVLIALAVFGAIIGGAMFYLMRSRPGGRREQKTAIIRVSDAPALASLDVLEGPKGMIGERIKITKTMTTLGRKGTDMIFYADYEKSSVSRLHCTIRQDSHNLFTLIDNKSTNGTWLYGRKRLKPDAPEELVDGDEIVLGDMGRQGVKLRFNVGAGGKKQPDDSGGTNIKTRIVKD